jgi:hypothetical protein
LFVTWITRASKSGVLASVDANTGRYRVIARDSTKTFVEIGPPSGDPVSWYVHEGQPDAFWWSERDGWCTSLSHGRRRQRTSGPSWCAGRIGA